MYSTDPSKPEDALRLGTVTVMAPPARLCSARLVEDAVVIVTSLSDEETSVFVRWWWEGSLAWEQHFDVPPRGTIRAFPDCFYGGSYRVRLVGQGWERSRDYGPRIPFCY